VYEKIFTKLKSVLLMSCSFFQGVLYFYVISINIFINIIYLRNLLVKYTQIHLEFKMSRIDLNMLHNNVHLLVIWHIPTSHQNNIKIIIGIESTFIKCISRYVRRRAVTKLPTQYAVLLYLNTID